MAVAGYIGHQGASGTVSSHLELLPTSSLPSAVEVPEVPGPRRDSSRTPGVYTRRRTETKTLRARVERFHDMGVPARACVWISFCRPALTLLTRL